MFDPVGFVRFCFPWGEGDLAAFDGPDRWQIDTLEDIGREALRTMREGGAVRLATASGHGIGKTACMAWIILWVMSTRPHCQIVVTANTATQLETKTWRELARWWKRALNRDWFEWTATKFYQKDNAETWYASATPWSAERSEAFAGTHEKHVVILFDEGSAIDDVIWEVAEGALTTPGAMHIVFGNPTRNTGRFRECFDGGRFAHRWITRQVDSRTARMADNKQLDAWIEDYGEDSDFCRVRVRGLFPRAGSAQFISSEAVQDAMRRELHDHEVEASPRVLGVDVARFGDDRTVFVVRQGAKVRALYKFRGLDVVQTANKAKQLIADWSIDVTYVDAIGIGAGVVDILEHTGFEVIPVVNSERPDDMVTYLNRRAECWGRLRDWLRTADIPDDGELRDDLIAPEYHFTSKNQIQLEKKEDMKKRLGLSPDIGDALATTFYSEAAVSEFYDDDMPGPWVHAGAGRSAHTGY